MSLTAENDIIVEGAVQGLGAQRVNDFLHSALAGALKPRIKGIVAN